MVAEDSGENIKRLKTWFMNRRTKAKGLAGKKSTKRESTIHRSSRRPKSNVDWGKPCEEQFFSKTSESFKVPAEGLASEEADKKQTAVCIPSRTHPMTSDVMDDLLLERDSVLIQDKEYHEMMCDSDW
ncbi:uncharacterized protein LOC133190939 [Saccostrea echinata]|uniref:uncharacterized protein LOC133190939 n=1 Tax=Saccostrea echinata TaxID=191078 RepID=UPI002A7F100B|nr:uncharacterized protein LOC133190939 [Saccostrea echinata]